MACRSSVRRSAILLVAVMGVGVHYLIIEPVLGSAPINQLLATGGLLFFLQSFATLLFGTDFRNIGVRLPLHRIRRYRASASPGCWPLSPHCSGPAGSTCF